MPARGGGRDAPGAADGFRGDVVRTQTGQHDPARGQLAKGRDRDRFASGAGVADIGGDAGDQTVESLVEVGEQTRLVERAIFLEDGDDEGVGGLGEGIAVLK